MTEDEAKTKRCPMGAGEFVKIANPEQPEPRVNIRVSNCIGSACMAWRDVMRRDPETLKIAPGTGFCGLAGASS